MKKIRSGNNRNSKSSSKRKINVLKISKRRRKNGKKFTLKHKGGGPDYDFKEIIPMCDIFIRFIESKPETTEENKDQIINLVKDQLKNIFQQSEEGFFVDSILNEEGLRITNDNPPNEVKTNDLSEKMFEKNIYHENPNPDENKSYKYGGSSWSEVTNLITGDMVVDGTIGADQIVTAGLNADIIKAGTLEVARIPSTVVFTNEIDGTSGVMTADENEIINTVITQTISDMRTGDEVGTYRVATSNPGNGTWTNKGTWFVDTTYSGTTNYKLWLKRSMAVEPGTYVYPICKDGTSGLKEVDIAVSSNLVQNILLPILTRQMQPNLQYNQQLIQHTGVTRGIIYDTRLSGTSETQSNPPSGTDPGPSDVYKSFSTPSGSATSHEVQYFYLV